MADEATLLKNAAEKLERYNDARRALAEASRELVQARTDLETHQQETAALIEQLSTALTEEGVAAEPSPKKRAAKKASPKKTAEPAKKAAEVPTESEPAPPAEEPVVATAGEEAPANDADEFGLEDWEVGEPDEEDDPTPAPVKQAPAADPDEFDNIEF